MSAEILLIIFRDGSTSSLALSDISTLMLVKDPREVSLALEGLPDPAEPSPEDTREVGIHEPLIDGSLIDAAKFDYLDEEMESRLYESHVPIPAEDRDEFKQSREEWIGQEVEIRGETWTVGRHVRGSLYVLTHHDLGKRYAGHSSKKGWRWWVNNTGAPIERKRATRKDKGTNERDKPQPHHSHCCHSPGRHMSRKDGFCVECRNLTAAQRAGLKQNNMDDEGAEF